MTANLGAGFHELVKAMDLLRVLRLLRPLRRDVVNVSACHQSYRRRQLGDIVLVISDVQRATDEPQPFDVLPGEAHIATTRSATSWTLEKTSLDVHFDLVLRQARGSSQLGARHEFGLHFFLPYTAFDHSTEDA